MRLFIGDNSSGKRMYFDIELIVDDLLDEFPKTDAEIDAMQQAFADWVQGYPNATPDPMGNILLTRKYVTTIDEVDIPAPVI